MAVPRIPAALIGSRVLMWRWRLPAESTFPYFYSEDYYFYYLYKEDIFRDLRRKKGRKLIEIEL
jgi:hypothetical protein